MNIWLIADTHFNHRKMEEYCDRPKDFEKLIWEGLKQILDEDLLIHLGDICIGGDTEIHYHLRGILKCKKILVKGNHDKKSNNWYLNNGWDFVCNSFSDELYGKKILFSHCPKQLIKEDINIFGHFHNALPRLLKKEWVIKGEKERNREDLKVLTDNHKLLALEYTNYQPITLKNFLTKQP